MIYERKYPTLDGKLNKKRFNLTLEKAFQNDLYALIYRLLLLAGMHTYIHTHTHTYIHACIYQSNNNEIIIFHNVNNQSLSTFDMA